MAALVLATSCGPPAAGDPGNVFASDDHPVSTWSFTKPIPVGEEWVALWASMRNESNLPVRLRSVRLAAEGFGEVVEIVAIEIAPRTSKGGTVPGGMYSTYPPAWFEGGRCAIVEPQPVQGHVVPPGGYPRIMLRLRAVKPGPFRISAFVVSYEQGSFVFEESLPIRMKGGVSATGDQRFIPEPEERRCLREGARILH